MPRIDQDTPSSPAVEISTALLTYFKKYRMFVGFDPDLAIPPGTVYIRLCRPKTGGKVALVYDQCATADGDIRVMYYKGSGFTLAVFMS